MLRIISISVLSLATIIAGCAPGTEPTAQFADVSPYDPAPMLLKIKGADVKPALDTEAKVVAFLDDLDAPGSGNNLRARINLLLNRPTDELYGLGGIQARTSLGAAGATLGDQGRFERPLDHVDIVGQIQEQVDGEPGFYFNPGDPMHMWVKITTTTTRTLGNGLRLEFQRAEMFRVEVAADGVEVEAKQETGDPFPRWTAAAGFQVDPKDFNYKLWAVGDKIRVTDYWVDNTCQPECGNTWQKYESTTIGMPPSIAAIFDLSPEACIDMMFKEDPTRLPNHTLPSDAEPPFYCLGRCKEPPILNTK